MVELYHINTKDIVFQEGLRKTPLEEKSLEELAYSIAKHGVLQPILVDDSKPGGYAVVIGERRARAAIMAGLEKIPVQISMNSLNSMQI